ncbi:MAG: hypothetical protein AAGD01_16375 [Acidobacteriota bacterium]
MRSILTLALLALTWLSVAPPAAAGSSEPEAVALAQRTVDAMGGTAGWDEVRHVHFNFANFRSHTWDKATGDHRIEGRTRDGNTYVVLHNLNSREGRAWKNGEETTGEEQDALLQSAYGAWINDTYWLLAPYKLLDPGVTLSYEGKEELDDTVYETVKLTFDSVGLTPGDTYWVYIDHETGLVGRWAYVLESAEEGAEATAWRWTDWQSYGPVKLASGRSLVGGERELPLVDIAIYDTLPAAVYTDPAAKIEP